MPLRYAEPEAVTRRRASLQWEPKGREVSAPQWPGRAGRAGQEDGTGQRSIPALFSPWGLTKSRFPAILAVLLSSEDRRDQLLKGYSFSPQIYPSPASNTMGKRIKRDVEVMGRPGIWNLKIEAFFLIAKRKEKKKAD